MQAASGLSTIEKAHSQQDRDTHAHEPMALMGMGLDLGPAGLAALVLAAITNIGAFDLFLCAVLIAGILQILMSVARLGGIANYFPSSVIKGMLTSIGILIIAKQIPHAVGYEKEEKGNE